MKKETFDSSYLVAKFVKKHSKDAKNILPMMCDIIKSVIYEPKYDSLSNYRKKWMIYLENSGNRTKSVLVENILKKDIFMSGRLLPILYLFDRLSFMNESNRTNNFNIHVKDDMCSTSSLVYVLHGYDSDSVKWNELKKRYYFDSSYKPTTYQLLKRVSEIGNMIRFIKDYIESQNTIIQSQVSNVLRQILQEHMSHTSSIDTAGKLINLRQIDNIICTNAVENIRSAFIIVSTIIGTKGGQLLNSLFDFMLHGDPYISSIASQMHESAMIGIEYLVTFWVTKGQLNDPHDEFFIKENKLFIPCSDWWCEKYRVSENDIPSSYSKEFVETVFSTGKSVSFLHTWDQPQEIEFDGHVEYEQLIKESSFFAKQMLNHTLNKEGRLLEWFYNILDYVLLDRGDFLSEFLSNIKYSIRLSSLKSKFPKSPQKYLFFNNDKENPCFWLDIPDPYTCVFKKKDMLSYQLVSSILLKVKNAEYLLAKLRLPKGSPQVSFILRYEIASFIKIVLDFLHIQVIQVSKTQFMECLRSCKPLDEILESHNRFIHEITRGCWVTRSGREVRDKLLQMIGYVKSFAESNFSYHDLRKSFYIDLFEFIDLLEKHPAGGRVLIKPIIQVFGDKTMLNKM